MWRAGRLDPGEVKKLKAARERLDLTPLVIHDNYLINLAARNPRLHEQSVAAFRGEVKRAVEIGGDYLVAHPGSYGDQGLEQGIRTVIESLRAATRGLKLKRLVILIENTAGGGTRLGGRFEELKAMREAGAKHIDAEIGFCLDTAHCLASDYDVATAEGLRHTVRQAEELLGLGNVRVIHANDSKTPLGSHADRHQHIGEGYIGAAGFRRILAHPKLRSKPFILETPLDRKGDDRRNVETLWRLSRRGRPPQGGRSRG